MISTPDLYKEIKTIEDVIKAEKDEFKKASLKAQVLNLKLLHNMRTNTVRIMDHFKVEKVRPKTRETVSETKPEEKRN